MYKPPFPQSNFPFSDANDPAQNRSPFTIPTVADKRKKAEKTPKASQNQQKKQPRKSKGKPKNMDFISQRERLDGTVSFCVQIRKRVGGNSLKSSKTFHTLEEARTWRDNTLAEIQLGLFEPAQKSCAKTTIRICDVISRRLSEGRELQSSATAELKRLAKHPKCKVPLEQLSLDWFIDFAKELAKPNLRSSPVKWSAVMFRKTEGSRWKTSFTPPKSQPVGLGILQPRV